MITINNEIVNIEKFPDGTQRFEFNKNLKKSLLRNEIDIVWKYESDSELFSLCCLKDWIDFTFEETKIYLYIPYLPNARQDRVKGTFDVFTLKTFCKIINSLNFTTVFVTDVHSNVSTALLDRCYNVSPKDYINTVFDNENIDIMFYPDEGSAKRYSDLFSKPYMFGVKKREWETGKIKGLDIITNDVDYKDKNVLIVDDICSYGGTIYHSAKKLKELGVNKIYVFITHCENSILEGELIKSGLVERIYTTDSLITKTHPLITII